MTRRDDEFGFKAMFKEIPFVFKVAWLGSFLLSLVLTCAFIWGIIEVVGWVTTK